MKLTEGYHAMKKTCSVIMLWIAIYMLPVIAWAQSDAGALGIFEKQVNGLPGASAAAFNSHGDIAVLCPDSGEVVLVREGQIVQRLPLPPALGIDATHPIGDIAYLKNSSWVIGGAGGVMIFDASEPPRLRTLGEIGDIHSICVSADGAKIVASVGFGKGARIVVFAVDSGQQLREIVVTGETALRFPQGVAIDNAGAIYVADAWRCQVMKMDIAGNLVWVFSEYGDQVGFLSSPAGLVLHEGAVFVADTRNHRVDVVDAVTGKRRDSWGTHALRPRAGHGKLHYPQDIAISIDGQHLVVCEPWEDRIQIFRRAEANEELERRKYADRGAYTHFGDFIATDSKLMAVLQPDSHRVLVYNIGTSHDERPEPVLIGALGEFGTRSGQFVDPGALALDAKARRVYVADRGNHRLCALKLDWNEDERLRFNPSLLTFARSVDLVAISENLGLSHVIAPRGIVKVPGPDGKLLLADEANGALWLVDRMLARFQRVKHQGVGTEHLKPVALAIRAHGNAAFIAVTDADKGTVFTGQLKKATASLAAAPFPTLGDSQGVAILDNGSVVVTDRTSHRVIVASRADDDWSVHEPATTLSLGMGLKLGQVFKPRACVTTDDGRLFVIDRGNHRLEVWSEELECIAIFGARLFTLDALRELLETE